MSDKKELPFPKVQKCWARVLQQGEQDESKKFGPNFYRILHTDFPFLKEQDFKNTNMAAQRVNLPAFITKALSVLDDMPVAVGALQDCGRRHILYGTPDAYYPVVGANIIKTLKHILPASEMDAETEAEWLALYAVMQKTMTDACHDEKSGPFWKKFYKKRGGEIAKLFEKVGNSSRYTGLDSKVDLAQIGNAIANTQSAAPAEALASQLTDSQLENLKKNLIAAVEAAKGAKPPLFDEWIIGSLADMINAGKNKKYVASSGCSSCCGVQCTATNMVLFGGLAAAVGVAAFFFLKKQ